MGEFEGCWGVVEIQLRDEVNDKGDESKDCDEWEQLYEVYLGSRF